ncbi:hypothetical protein [Pseudolactococcus laudensis]|uniref:hypothetical protein n=1 Tax=Pseudolactococcus laudensis TaxID=1494461 RepID=UPI002FC66EE3
MRGTGGISKIKSEFIGAFEDKDVIHIDKNASMIILSSQTWLNDSVYFVYNQELKLGWHFISDKNSGKIDKYIGPNEYLNLIEHVLNRITKIEKNRSFKLEYLNLASKEITENNLKSALVNLLILVRENHRLNKQQVIFVLRELFIILHQIENQGIDKMYYIGNLVYSTDEKLVEFNEKYKQIFEEGRNINHEMRCYVWDILKLYESDILTNLDFVLRNLEVYIRDDSVILNEISVKHYTENIIENLL